MTAVETAPAVAAKTDAESAGSGTSADDVAGRGRLTIDPSVVRKIAEYAADRVPGTARAPRRIAGVGAGSHGATAKVTGDNDAVDVVLDLALHYPAPVREVVDEVRASVTGDLVRLTSYRVRSLDVTVSALLAETRPRVE